MFQSLDKDNMLVSIKGEMDSRRSNPMTQHLVTEVFQQ